MAYCVLMNKIFTSLIIPYQSKRYYFRFRGPGCRGRDRMVVWFIATYICNQCLSPLTLWIWILLMVKCTQYNMW